MPTPAQTPAPDQVLDRQSADAPASPDATAAAPEKVPILRRIPIIRHLLVAFGFVCVGLGAIGVVLPILPTTPFLLLAAACFANGSERFHSWFCATKLYKNHLEGFVKHRSMPMKTKLCICIPVSALLIAIGVATPVLPMRICLGVLIAVKWWFFLFWIKTEPAPSAGFAAEDVEVAAPTAVPAAGEALLR